MLGALQLLPQEILVPLDKYYSNNDFSAHLPLVI